MRLLWVQSLSALVGLAAAQWPGWDLPGWDLPEWDLPSIDRSLDGIWRRTWKHFPLEIDIVGNSDGYSGSFKLLNRVFFSMDRQSDDSLVTTIGLSTSIPGDVEITAAERQLTSFMGSVTDARLADDKILSLTGTPFDLYLWMFEWRDDGMGFTEAVDTEVTVISPWWWNSKINAQYTDGVELGFSNSHYWEVVASQAVIDFGLTSNLSFAASNNIKGYFYNSNGDLYDGTGMAPSRVGFGPSVSAGDRLGMLVDFQDTMKVWFFLNDGALGLAVDVPIPPVTVYPTVSLKSRGSAVITRLAVPDTRDPPAATIDSTEWSSTFEGYAARLEIEETPEGYSGVFQLINTVAFTMARQPDGTVVTSLGDATNIWSPIPDMLQADQSLQTFMAAVTEVRLVDEGLLELSGATDTLNFERPVQPPPIYDEIITE